MVHCQTTTAPITMQRLQHIDFMKGVAIFLVVLGHVYQFSLNNCGTMFKFIYLFHMPFFFMLSGYFAYRTNLTLYHFKKKTVRLLVPFLVWDYCMLSLTT